jgi:AcrR family transcriptional regulator
VSQGFAAARFSGVPTVDAVEDSLRRAILDAALESFLVDGVSGTTIDQVRRRSGASVGCIYHHFGSKERLAADLYLEILREYQLEFLTALRSSGNPRVGVEGAVHRHFRWVARHTDRANYLFHCREPEVTAAFDASARNLNAAFYAEAGAWLGRHVDEGQIRLLPAALYHALWMGPSLEYSRQWLGRRPRRTAELKATAPIVADAAWHALKANGRA